MRRFNPERTILNGVQTDTWGDGKILQDTRHAVITCATRGMESADTIKFEFGASNQDVEPTWASADVYNNRHSKVRVRNLTTGALVLGNEGITITNSNASIRYVIEDDNPKWINVKVTISDESNTYAYAFLSTANDSE